MDACLAVEREVGNVLERLNTFVGNHDSEVKVLREQIRRLQQELQQDKEMDSDAMLSPNSVISYASTLSHAKERLAKLSADHRDLHSTVSKVGKSIDRNFDSDFDSTSREDVFAGQTEQKLINETILQHFYRQGQLEIADTLATEARLAPDVEMSKGPFQELNAIVEALNERNLQPALDWAQKNRLELKEKGTASIVRMSAPKADGHTIALQSSLEMKLHKLQFIELLKAGSREDAVAYSRCFFPQFVESHEREIQSLMGALIYANAPGRLENSPYSHLLDNSLWMEISDLFVKDACALMGLSIESPLTVVVNAGCKALPALLNIKQVMQQRNVSGVWSAKDELPIEIDLGPDARYHSIFACPILRQQTNETNPPLRLTCGHCISRDALGKLANTTHKMKCPYCPVEQSPSDARQITF